MLVKLDNSRALNPLLVFTQSWHLIMNHLKDKLY